MPMNADWHAVAGRGDHCMIGFSAEFVHAVHPLEYAHVSKDQSACVYAEQSAGQGGAQERTI